MMDSYYSRSELKNIGFKKLGENVQVSRKASVYGAANIEIGNNVRIDDFAFLSGRNGGGQIAIGNYVHIAAYSALYGKCGIEIGDYVNISSRVTIYSTSDDYSGEYMCGPMVDQALINDIGRKINIESHCIIGTGSVLLPGAVLHEGVAVGAMSLVKEEMMPYMICAGIPAKYIKKRSKRGIELLHEWSISF